MLKTAFFLNKTTIYRAAMICVAIDRLDGGVNV
jgi:hypothetical protein